MQYMLFSHLIVILLQLLFSLDKLKVICRQGNAILLMFMFAVLDLEKRADAALFITGNNYFEFRNCSFVNLPFMSKLHTHKKHTCKNTYTQPTDRLVIFFYLAVI